MSRWHANNGEPGKSPYGNFASSPFEATCWRCGEHYADYRDVVQRKGKYICRSCSPGAGDDYNPFDKE